MGKARLSSTQSRGPFPPRHSFYPLTLPAPSLHHSSPRRMLSQSTARGVVIDKKAQGGLSWPA